MKIFDAFERIVVINLRERIDRRREMEAELRRAGIAAGDARLQFFAGVRPADAGLFPSIGARGCFESHLGVIGEALRDRIANVLVLEDDLLLHPAACVGQPALVGRLAQGQWDFAYPGHMLPLGQDGGPVHWQETRSPLVCAHFYGLHRRVLADLREYLEDCRRRPPGHPDGGPMHVDGAYSMFRGRHPAVVTLAASPSLGGQRSSRSDITANRWFDRQPGVRLLAGLARKGKNLWRASTLAATSSRPQEDLRHE
jgi:glycosyl transferase family 25